MSWCAMAVMPSVAQAAELATRMYCGLERPSFGQCSYCKRLPDTNQTNSNCLGCGAALPQSTTTTQTVNYSNHDSRKKKPAQPTGRKYSSVPDLMTGEGTSLQVQQFYTDHTNADTSNSDTSSSHCGSSDCGGSSDGGGCGGGGGGGE